MPKLVIHAGDRADGAGRRAGHIVAHQGSLDAVPETFGIDVLEQQDDRKIGEFYDRYDA